MNTLELILKVGVASIVTLVLGFLALTLLTASSDAGTNTTLFKYSLWIELPIILGLIGAMWWGLFHVPTTPAQTLFGIPLSTLILIIIMIALYSFYKLQY